MILSFTPFCFEGKIHFSLAYPFFLNGSFNYPRLKYDIAMLKEGGAMEDNYYLKHCLSVAYIQLLSSYQRNEISVAMICKKAAVSRSAFYRLFNNIDYQEELYVDYGLTVARDVFSDNTNLPEAISSLFRFLYKYQGYVESGINKDEASFLLFFYRLTNKCEENGSALLSLYPYIKEVAQSSFQKEMESAINEAKASLNL